MPLCPHCSTEVPTGSRYCPGCGAMQSSVSQMPTQMGGAPTPASSASRPPVSGTIGRLESSASFAGAAFQPGQMLSGRYRVIGLLGRGGMGEVYRADDLELSQAVSLKFLGRGLGDRPDMLDRFRAEVRNARQVSHPNICRVYDIGEVGGQYFLSMEYVDGEDLATLLKRIGRLPRAKADEVARQLCAGLAAAHDRGVIHRDLKPANVMIDGEGRVRITDFGLAVRAADGGVGDVVGTPAYMAPEQFEGKPATAQSDLYSLGLILYEIYTGRRALEAATWDGWKSQHSQVEPRSPEEIERDVEEPVARAILRCLEKDPAKRPRSALQLAASLPGGDPLAAALAAGETPSPQMVAEAGGEGALMPRAAWSLLAGFAALVVALLVLAPAATDLGLAPFTQSADVLEARAKDIVVKLGYTSPPHDGASWLGRNYDPMRWRAEHELSTHWRRDYAEMGAPLQLAWRQSPRLMSPAFGMRVNGEDPPQTISGMVSVVVDAKGRLNAFSAVPPQLDSSQAGVAPAHTAELFAFAGLDTAAFHEVQPVWLSLPAFETRREWLGSAAWMPGVPLRVSAAWWRDRPVAFAIRGPWSRPTRMAASDNANQNQVTTITALILSVLLMIVVAATARNRLQGSRNDLGGALRLAGFIMLLRLARWVLYAHHTFDMGDEFNAFGITSAFALLEAFILFFLYLAIEPQVRRRTPELLIGWARVLQGKFSDPRVGRDVLVGSLFGAAVFLVIGVVNALPTWLPFHAQTPIGPNTDMLQGGRVLLGSLVGLPTDVLVAPFALFGLWFLLRLVLKQSLWAAIGLAIVMTLLSLGAENRMLEQPGALLEGVLIAWVIWRHGLLALVAAWFMRTLLQMTPLPFTSTSPYASQSLLCLGLVLLLVGAAFHVSLGGRPALSLSLDE